MLNIFLVTWHSSLHIKRPFYDQSISTHLLNDYRDFPMSSYIPIGTFLILSILITPYINLNSQHTFAFHPYLWRNIMDGLFLRGMTAGIAVTFYLLFTIIDSLPTAQHTSLRDLTKPTSLSSQPVPTVIEWNRTHWR